MKILHHYTQNGSALVVALILLIALSLLAISSMNTATLDLIMAGNEQYKARAFSAAEAGISQALKSGNFNLNTNVSGSLSYGNYSDSFTYKIEKANNGRIEPAPAGSSLGSFGTIHYTITSTGTSVRSSSATVAQEVYEIVLSGGGSGGGNTPSQGSAQCEGTNLNTFC